MPRFTPALAVILAIAATMAGFYLAQPNPLAARVAELDRDLLQARNEIARLKADNEHLQAAHEATGSRIAAVVRAPHKPRLTPAVLLTPGGVQNPDGHYRLTVMDERHIDKNYDALISIFGFDDAELAAFKQLVHDRNASLLDEKDPHRRAAVN